MAKAKDKTLRLGDVCEKIGSGATPRGGSEVYLSEGISFIRSQNIYNNYFQQNGLVYLDENQAGDLANVEVKPNDVLLNITGDSVARCCQVPKRVLPARVNQHVAIIRPNALKLNPRYLMYCLVETSMQEYMLAIAASGATRNALTKGMIENFEVPDTSIPIQNSIAHILGTLDNKIELNRKMNETLEAMAQALFKSWFVDFDPVHAKAEGRDTGLPKEIVDLFPSEFQKSELGKIPNGWATKGLDEVADFLNGLALQKYPSNSKSDLPVIKISQLNVGNTLDADRANRTLPPEYIVRDGDILFSWSGSLAVKIWCGGEGALNQHLFKVTSQTYPKWFYYLWTKHHLSEFQDIAANKATTMGHIQRKHLSEAKVLVPKSGLMVEMTKVFEKLIQKIIALNVESKILVGSRDKLLPELVSGKLSVEAFIEDKNE